MQVLFISNVYPPEVAPLANRLSEHARFWVAEGGQVEVITGNPNYPEGEIYPGYTNRLTREDLDGVRVTRVPMYITANEGTVKRTLSYISFMLSAVWFARRMRARPDLVAASSPQFFSAIAGYVISRLKRVPFLLEIRDLWPESVVAVGAMRRNAVIRFFEWVERFLYRKADHIVVVTDAFKREIAKKGVPESKISVLKNAADFDLFERPLDEAMLASLRRQHRLEGKFVVSYIGTIGMAHGIEVMLEAARSCDDPDVVFMVVGAGAGRDELAARAAEEEVSNFRLIDKQPRDLMPYFMALTDVNVVHLIKSPLFRTVIPSKIFDAMVMKRPVVLGVEGESREIIEKAEAGLVIEPEEAGKLLEAVHYLRAHPEEASQMGRNGYRYVCAHHDRKVIAARYWDLMELLVSEKAALVEVQQPAGAVRAGD